MALVDGGRPWSSARSSKKALMSEILEVQLSNKT